MRLFIAADMPKEIKEILYNFQMKLKPYVRASFVAKKNLHLTLKFLGEIDENDLSRIKNKLSNIKYENFDVRLDKLGFFPDEKTIRVIWTGLEPQEEIYKFQRTVDEELTEFFSLDTKFTSHLTLARVKNIKDQNKFMNVFKEVKFNNDFKIDSFSLIKSELKKDGPKYTILETYNLR